MSFFRRNKEANLIPPVAPTAGQQAAASASAHSDPYANPSRGPSGDPYARVKSSPAPSSGAGGDPYAQSAQGRAGDYNPYAKRGGEHEQARNELFAGFAAPEKPVAERKYGYEGREMEEDFDEDEEVEGIKQEMRGVKQESLASTRSARAPLRHHRPGILAETGQERFEIGSRSRRDCSRHYRQARRPVW